MRYALALAAAAVAVSAQERDCQAEYDTCIDIWRGEVLCGCDLATCVGQNNARNREFCESASASESASLALPPASVPGVYQTESVLPPASVPGVYPTDSVLPPASVPGVYPTGSVLPPASVPGVYPTSSVLPPISVPGVSPTSSVLPPISVPGVTPSIITGTAGSQPSGQPPITAPFGSIPLGGKCSDDDQCAAGVQCFGTTSLTIRTCGSFNAECTSDDQCATNTCQRGLCSGFLPTESYNIPAETHAPNSTMGGAQPTGTVHATSTLTPYTGSAASTGYGIAAVVFGFVAWVL